MGDGEHFVASDIPAILDYTQRMVFLEDREMALLTPGGVAYQTLIGGGRSTSSHRCVSLGPGRGGQGRLQALHAEGDLRADALDHRYAAWSRRSRRSRCAPRRSEADRCELEAIDKIYIVACGTAWHAGFVGKFLIETLARRARRGGLRLGVPLPRPDAGRATLMIAMTQSGETVDTLARMEVRAQGGRHVRLDRQRDRLAGGTLSDGGVIYLNAGIEIGVASTKAFTCMIVAQYLFALKLAQGARPPRRRHDARASAGAAGAAEQAGHAAAGHRDL